MHSSFAFLENFVIVGYAFESNFLTTLFLNILIDIHFNVVGTYFTVEFHELSFHCSRARNNVRRSCIHYFEYQGKVFLGLLKDIINFIDSDEFAIVKLHVSSFVPIQKRLRHTDNNIAVLMLILMQISNFKLQFLIVLLVTEIKELAKFILYLLLKQISLYDYDSLRPKNLIWHVFALTVDINQIVTRLYPQQ